MTTETVKETGTETQRETETDRQTDRGERGGERGGGGGRIRDTQSQRQRHQRMSRNEGDDTRLARKALRKNNIRKSVFAQVNLRSAVRLWGVLHRYPHCLLSKSRGWFAT